MAKKKANRSVGKGIFIFVSILLVLICLIWGLTGFITDYLWFKELGYVSVFFKQLFTQLKLGIPTFIIVTLLCWLYLSSLKRGYYKKINIAEDKKTVGEKGLNRIGLVISAVFGLLVTLNSVTKLWFEILQYINSTDFNIADPIFHKDVSFYIFKLEFIAQINALLMGLVGAFIIVTLLYYMVLMSTRPPQVFTFSDQNNYSGPGSDQNLYFAHNGHFGSSGFFGGLGGRKKKSQIDKGNLHQLLNIASKQIAALGVIFFLMVAINYWLKQFGLLYTGSSGVVYGASYTDINVTLWVYRLIMALAVISAITFVLGVRKRSLKIVLVAPILMLVVALAGGGASSLIQNLVVSPDELNKEYPFLENNITFTRYAYGLQDIETRNFAATTNLTAADILNNMETISNIRINDFDPALKFYNQTQSIRLYYLFHDVDVDRYMVNGEYTQTFLSAREIDEDRTTDQWLSKHLKYTHGYGVTLSRVDKITDSGQPDMLIHSIPPVSQVDEIQITRPEIYFGEATDSYVITNTAEQEFDYPSGDSNVYSIYEGTGGIHLTPLNRLLFAIREQSVKILVSTNINRDSRIQIYRNIEDRVQKIAPFLSYESDPYIVTVDGGLYWIIDAYTTSVYYPYSEPYTSKSDVNYIRNSVKVVVDAYNGDASFYVVDQNDPIAITLQKIYPQLFKDIDAMPESLQAHLRYPNAMFSIQADVFSKYHMTDVNIFYQNEDAWSIATEIYGQEELPMEPTYYILSLPGEKKAEFISSIPYTPSGKYNLTGLLVARNDGDHYGELVLYQMPKNRIIYGPRQIEAQIDQDTKIAQDFTLWNSAGSTYTRGNMFVIPIENSLIYLEPVYLESANSALPEVKRIILYYADKIAYASNLADVLDQMFGEGAGALVRDSSLNTEDVLDNLGQPTVDQPGSSANAGYTQKELIQKANDTFEKALEAQKSGDWAAYGRYLQDLQSYLNQLASGDVSQETLPVEEGYVTEVPALNDDLGLPGNEKEPADPIGNTADGYEKVLNEAMHEKFEDGSHTTPY